MPIVKYKVCSYDFEKYLVNKDHRDVMISGPLKTKDLAILEDLEEYGPDRFFELAHQSENKLIMKNKFTFTFRQYANYRTACTNSFEILSTCAEMW